MGDDSGGKEVINGPNTPKFNKSDYSFGYFEPNGELIENPFDAKQLGDWDRMNDLNEGKLFGKGQKLTLPNLKDGGFKLVFGRDKNTCDLVIDMDITGDFAEREMAVSRRHFEIQKRRDGKWEVADLGSTNGVDCSREESGVKSVNLKNDTEPWVLKNGDTIVVGGGPGTAGRIIGFRYYEPEGGEPYLVKFNATSVDELATASGLYNQRPDLLGKLPTESLSEEVQKQVEEKGENLVALHLELDELQKSGEKTKYYEKSYLLNTSILAVVKDLGDRFYQGDWAIAAGEIGSWAYKKGDELIKEKGEGISEDEYNKVKTYLTLSSQLMELSVNYVYKG